MSGFSTTAIHGHECRDVLGSHIPPVYVGNIYEYVDEELGLAHVSDNGRVLKYGREENPTTRCLERVLAKLENAENALAFNSGMAAISATLLSTLSSGNEIVVSMEVYSTVLRLVRELSAKMNLRIVKSWPSAEAIAESVSRKTRVVFLEVLTNPTNKVIDLKKLASIMEVDSVILVVDNTFTTPILVKPILYGARLVIHSMTKYISGHNDTLGGAVIGYNSLLSDIWEWRRMLGGILQPLESYLTLRGLKTLEVRFEKSSRTALEIAEFLEDHPRVEEVYYPGLSTSPYHDIASRLFERRLYGGVVSFKVRGGYSDAVEFVRRLKLVKRAPSLGGAESLVTIPAKSAARYIDEESRRKLGITDNLVRLSVGLEDSRDIIEDLSRALS